MCRLPCSPELAVALESEVVQMQNFLEKQGHGSSVSASMQAGVSLAAGVCMQLTAPT